MRHLTWFERSKILEKGKGGERERRKKTVIVFLVWFGLVWFGLVWFGLVWFGLI